MTGQMGDEGVWVTKNAALWCGASIATVGIYIAEELRRRKFYQRLRADQSAANLRDLDDAKNQLFANLSHELRTPLMLILATSEGLKNAISESAMTQQYEISKRNGLRLLHLLDDLLELSKLQSPTLKLDLQRVDIAATTREMVEHTRPLAERKDITISKNGADNLWAMADSSSIERVLTNLITNSLKFTPVGGKIDVTVSRGDQVTIAVSDNGSGVSEADQKHLFERYYQGTASKRVKRGGVGIGLSMCKRIIDLHDGTIKISSIEGRGTTVTVCLPLAPSVLKMSADVPSAPTFDAGPERGLLEWDRQMREDPFYRSLPLRDATERRAVNRPSDEGEKSRSVLVVDDSPDILEYLNLILSTDYRVYVASDGDEGLTLAKRLRPDLIISDISMPKMDGFEMLERVRADVDIQDTPVLLMTAGVEGDGRSDRRKGDSLHADAFLPKPFYPSDLYPILDRLLKRQQAAINHAVDSSTLATRVAVSGLAHDILNPIGFIKTAVFIIEESQSVIDSPQASSSDKEEARKDLQEALKSAAAGVARVVESVQQIRDFATGRAGTELKKADINMAIQRTLAVSSVSLAVQTNLKASKIPLLRVGQLERVLLNLVLNAFQAGGRDCLVQVDSYDIDNGVAVQVRDNGPGMDTTTLKKAFDPEGSPQIMVRPRACLCRPVRRSARWQAMP